MRQNETEGIVGARDCKRFAIIWPEVYLRAITTSAAETPEATSMEDLEVHQGSTSQVGLFVADSEIADYNAATVTNSFSQSIGSAAKSSKEPHR